MNIGKLIRMNRLFSNPSGRLCSVAIDHFIGYPEGLPDGLRSIQSTLAAIIAGEPDAVTMHKGMAAEIWTPYAGKLPLILQSTIARVDDTACEQIATPEDAVRLGADAFAVAAFVRGSTEAAHLRVVAECVHAAIPFDMPVICHIYPRRMGTPPKNSYDPEDIAWAVRCATEAGADIVKTPYCGEVKAYAQIVADCPVPVVAAGGPRAQNLVSALEMMAEVVKSGAKGATIGRNVWGFDQVTAAVKSFKAVIHEGKAPLQAMMENGLS